MTHKPSLDLQETEFEEDYSDLEEYSGRRSEDSVGFQCLVRLLFWASIDSYSLGKLARQLYHLLTSFGRQPRKMMAFQLSIYRQTKQQLQSQLKDQSDRTYSDYLKRPPRT